MLTKSAAEWKNMATRILDPAGSVHEESVWVAESLVDANVAGHDTPVPIENSVLLVI